MPQPPTSTPSVRASEAAPELLAVLRWLNRRTLSSRFPQWNAASPSDDDPDREVGP